MRPDSPAELMRLRAAQAREADASDVPSPCISVCRMSPDTGLCLGCFRSLDEISAWSRMDDGGKRAIWRLIEQRAGIVGIA